MTTELASAHRSAAPESPKRPPRDAGAGPRRPVPRAKQPAGTGPVPAAVSYVKPASASNSVGSAIQPAAETVAQSAAGSPLPTSTSPPMGNPYTPVFIASKIDRIPLAERVEEAKSELENASSAKKRLTAAEKLVNLLRPADLAALADSTDPEERKPARVALEYIGEEDVSWSNAQHMLLKGRKFIDEILGMEGDAFITKRSLPLLEEFGALNPAELQGRSTAAYTLALYLDTCITLAKQRLKLDDIDLTVGELAQLKEVEKHNMQSISLPRGVSPVEEEAWPRRVNMDKAHHAVLDAARCGKTALVVCNGRANEVESFLSLSLDDCTTIDVKSIVPDVTLKTGVLSKVEDSIMAFNLALVEALTMGRPLHISLSDTKVSFQDTFSVEGFFPKAVFNTKRLALQAQGGHIKGCKKTAKHHDPEDPKCYSFVTTDFSMDDACKHLETKLPFFDEMAIVEIVRFA